MIMHGIQCLSHSNRITSNMIVKYVLYGGATKHDLYIMLISWS